MGKAPELWWTVDEAVVLVDTVAELHQQVRLSVLDRFQQVRAPSLSRVRADAEADLVRCRVCVVRLRRAEDRVNRGDWEPCRQARRNASQGLPLLGLVCLNALEARAAPDHRGKVPEHRGAAGPSRQDPRSPGAARTLAPPRTLA